MKIKTKVIDVYASCRKEQIVEGYIIERWHGVTTDENGIANDLLRCSWRCRMIKVDGGGE